MLYLGWYHKNKLIAIKKGDVKIFKGVKRIEVRAGMFGATGLYVPAGEFGLDGAYVTDVLFGTSGAFRVAGSSVMGVSFVGQHAHESWVW